MSLLFERSDRSSALHWTDVSEQIGMHMSPIRYRDSHRTQGQPDAELPNPTQKIIIGSTSALSCLRHQAGWAEDTHSVSFFLCLPLCSTCSRPLYHTCCQLFGISTSGRPEGGRTGGGIRTGGGLTGCRHDFMMSCCKVAHQAPAPLLPISCLRQHPASLMSEGDWILASV